eukprot:CAMPEP_0168610748 /NCGR_PEP_ID=MMETSP0449_2-20121227/1961_1 /TAXON_ID=1082188 /ORGANISM="Strombidium rassoulzadegani, Strain ras09" /LENGTH=74 /DNA_ID=CAMNT_0008651091 /DNA_START=432 /DNA_END=652 /DNA_ORIENTATION=-
MPGVWWTQAGHILHTRLLKLALLGGVVLNLPIVLLLKPVEALASERGRVRDPRDLGSEQDLLGLHEEGVGVDPP